MLWPRTKQNLSSACQDKRKCNCSFKPYTFSFNYVTTFVLETIVIPAVHLCTSLPERDSRDLKRKHGDGREKCRLKSALICSFSSRLFQQKEHHCLFTSSIKHEIRYFRIVVMQKLERNVQSSVLHVQSCSLAYLKTYCFLDVFALP